MSKPFRYKEKWKSSTLRLPETLADMLARIADRKRLSVAQSVERAVAEYVFQYGTPKDREWIGENFDDRDLFTGETTEELLKLSKQKGGKR